MNSTQEIVKEILSKPGAKMILDQVADELSIEEVMRQEFYDWVDENKKVEFINGEIIEHSPVPIEHNDATKSLLTLMDIYVKKHKSGYVGVEKVMVKFTRNDYEPDLCFFGEEKRKLFKKGQNLFPVPDLVVEIWSKPTKKNDQTTKFVDYQNHNVGEYWMIDPIAKSVEQYRLVKKEYKLILKGKDGTIPSEMIKGFSIPIQAIFDEDIQLETLQKILSKK